MSYTVKNLTNAQIVIGSTHIDPGEDDVVDGPRVRTLLDNLKAAGKISYSQNSALDASIVASAKDSVRDDFTDLTGWTPALAGSDYTALDGNAIGGGYLRVVKSALAANTHSILTNKKAFALPARVVFGLTLSQKIGGEEFYVELVSADANTDPTTPAVLTDGVVDNGITISSFTIGITTAANVARIQLASWPADGLKAGDRFCVSGLTETRLNVGPIAITNVFPQSREVIAAITFTTGTYSPTNGVFTRISPSGNARDCAGFLFEGASASTNALLVTRGSGRANLVSGVTNMGTSYSDALQASTQPYTYAFQPRFNTELHLNSDKVTWLSQAMDSTVVLNTSFKRTQGLPSYSQEYVVRLRARNLPNKSIPVARITAVSKSGTTTATVTTDQPHGLAVGNYIQAYGVLDQTNFANLSTAAPVASVISSTQFTVVWGSAVTATSYGGAVIIQHGAVSTAVQTQVVASVARSTNGFMCVGTNNSAPTVLVGDTVRLYGLVDSTNAVLSGFEGSFKVAHVTPAIWVGTTTNLAATVTGIADTSLLARGMYVSGTGIPASTQIISIQDGVGFTMSANATASNTVAITVAGMIVEVTGTQARNANLMGGAFLKESELRVHFLRVLDYARTPVEVVAGVSTGDIFDATPVQVMNNASVTVSNTLTINTPSVNQGTTAAAPGWYVQPGAAFVNDVASAALTTTTTTAAVTQNGTNCAQFNIPVTAVSGTTPTLDVNIEESDDTGTNWFTIYSFPRITATGMYRSPPLRLLGNRIRYVQTVGGTTPSFTRAINRNNLPFLNPDHLRLLIDRALVVNTISSTSLVLFNEGAVNLQMVLALGTVTTSPPTVQMQGSEDNALWYNIPGTLAGVASSAVQLTVTNVTAKFVRAIVTIAGSGANLNYLVLKGFGG